MRLQKAMDDYVLHKQSLGFDFTTGARILRSLINRVGNIPVNRLTGAVVKEFVYGTGPVTSNVHSKLAVLRGLYRYMLVRGYVKTSPLPVDLPKQPERLIPYIYTREELRRIINAAKQQRDTCYLESHTFHALILLLYGAALRISEALRLTIADVDLTHSLLIIRDTKFYKTRCVPLGPDLTNALNTYSLVRHQRKHPAPPEAFFLVTRNSQPVDIQLAELSFKRLCEASGVRRRDGGRFGTRLHDMRHTFAVHRLIACYREGGDPQQFLPHLATFLGHSDISHTVRYLTLIPELLHHASKRFENYAFPGGEE